MMDWSLEKVRVEEDIRITLLTSAFSFAIPWAALREQISVFGDGWRGGGRSRVNE